MAMQVKVSSHFDLRRQKALWIICLVSFLWSCSSLMVFSVFPSFLIEELGLSHSGLGMIEGLAVGMSFAVQVCAGIASDHLGRRHVFINTGTFLSAVAKLGFAGVFSLKAALMVRLLDRVSKGIRAAPTEAYLADLGVAHNYGYVFGLRQSLYTFGAVVGAGLAMLILHLDSSGFRTVFLLATIPASLAFIFLLSLPRLEIERRLSDRGQFSIKKYLPRMRELPIRYWLLILFIFPLMLARFSEAFLSLHLRSLGLSIEMLPLVIVVMDIVHVSMALPAGFLADQIGKTKLLAIAVCVQFVGSLTLYHAFDVTSGLIGVVLVGLNMGASQGVLRASIAESCPGSLRGSGFGIFYAVSGVAALMGNMIAGNISQHFGIASIFCFAAGLSLLACLFLSIQGKLEKLIHRLMSKNTVLSSS